MGLEIVNGFLSWIMGEAPILWKIGYPGSLLVFSFFIGYGFSVKKYEYRAIIIIVVEGIYTGALLYFFDYDFMLNLLMQILPTVVIGYILNAFVFDSEDSEGKEKGPYDVLFTAGKGKVKFVLNLIRGAVIFGAAGSGKTATGFSPIIKHVIFNRLSGIIYDHKDFELAEIAYYFHELAKREGTPPLPIRTICFHEPDFSDQINPIAPKYLESTDDVKVLAHALMENLSSDAGSSDNATFFNGAKAAIAGTMWRLKIDYPDKCNIPYLSSILLQKTSEEVIEFIQGNRDAALLGAPFLDARDNERLIGSFKNGISDALVNIVSPKVFYVLSGDDFNLALNRNENPELLLLVNQPGKAKFFNPLHALIFTTAKLQMCVRNRNPSLMVLDEAGQIKFSELYNIPALLRSYGIGTIFGIQDKVQGSILYKENEMKALLANLSTKMFGKSNLPETSKFYEQYFELIKEDQKSVSKKKNTGIFASGPSDARETVSQREIAEHRAFEFDKLLSGEFHVFNEAGKHMFARWDLTEFEPMKPKRKKSLSETELQSFYENILDEAKNM